jgi:glycosyltransferase involved in cell wall biosynthesis
MSVRSDDPLPPLRRDDRSLASFLGDAPSTLLFERAPPENRNSRVTVSIPTFNRPDLLKETIESVWAQEGFDDYEVIIVDNASSSENVAKVLDFLRSSPHPVRYYLNADNVGGFPNWNRCLAYARTEWVSVLNDDDLLKPLFLAEAMRHIDRDPNIDAIVCQADLLDQRAKGIRKNRAYTRIRPALISALRFMGRDHIRLTPKRLFWSNIAGSSLGSLYRRDKVLDLGGFDQREAPNGDYVLNVRLAIHGKFIQLRSPLALMRLQVNDSASPSTFSGVLIRNHGLRERMVEEGLVPKAWRRWNGHLLAHEFGVLKKHWKTNADIVDISERSGGALSRDSASWMYLVRLARGGL